MSKEPVRVAVLGSCITRDVFYTRFNRGYKAMWQCDLLQNQSSLISIMSSPLLIPDDQLGEQLSDYNKHQVRTDTSKTFLQRLVEVRPEYLILDFFGDIHFGVLEVAPDQYVTNNRWTVQKTQWHAARKAHGELKAVRIEDDIDAYLRLWEEALQRLQVFLSEHLPDMRVVIHRGRNAERWLPEGAARPRALAKRKKLMAFDVGRANALWRRLDEIAGATDGWDTIDLTDREYLSFEGHPWGVFYVHYTLDYYDEFLAALNALHLSRTLPEGTVENAMVTQLGEARRRRHREIATLTDDVRRLERRVLRLRSELTLAGQRRRFDWLRAGSGGRRPRPR